MDSIRLRWSVYIQRIDTIYFQIWRPVWDNQFTLVWQTPFNPTKTGINVFDVEEPVNVKEGDKIGFRYKGGGVIPYKMENWSDSSLPERRWYYAGTMNSEVDKTYSFVFDSTDCRIYSIKVIGLKGQ